MYFWRELNRGDLQVKQGSAPQKPLTMHASMVMRCQQEVIQMGQFHASCERKVQLTCQTLRSPGIVLPEAQSCGLLCWCCSSSWQRRWRITPPRQCCCSHLETLMPLPWCYHNSLASSLLSKPQSVPRLATAAGLSTETCPHRCPWLASAKERLEEKNCEVK